MKIVKLLVTFVPGNEYAHITTIKIILFLLKVKKLLDPNKHGTLSDKKSPISERLICQNVKNLKRNKI